MTDANDANRGRLLARNSLLNLAGLTAPLIIGVLAMPAVFEGLGADGFGLLGLVWTVLGYLTLLDLGLGRATTKFAAAAIAARDQREIAALTHTAAVVQFAIGLVVAAAGIAAAAPLVQWLNVPPALQADATGSFVLIAVVAPLMALANTFRGLLEAGQRFAVVNLIRTPASAGNYLIPLAGVWLDWSLTVIVAGMVAVRAATFLGYGVACMRAWPSLGTSTPWDANRLRKLLSFGGWISVSSVVSPLLVYIDRFAIGALLTVAAVGFYTAPHEVVTRLAILPMSIVATVFPAFAAFSSAAGSGERSRILFVRSTKYVLALAAPPLLAIAAFSSTLLGLWLGPDFALRAAPALAILSLGMIVNAAAHIPSTLLQAVGRADVTAKLHLLELPLHVLVLWVLTARWGITGAALAWTLRVTLDALLLFGATARMGLVSTSVLAGERLPFTTASLAGCGVALAVVALLLDDAVARAAIGLLVLSVWAAFAWTRALSPLERTEFLVALGFGRTSRREDIV